MLSQADGLITPDSLLWVTSQSGRSTEIARCCSSRAGRAILGITNDTTSPLAAAADAVIELRSGAEHAIGTRSYLNSVAAHLLAATVAAQRPVSREVCEMPGRFGDYLNRRSARHDGESAAWIAIR